jgi:hypothetical protein
VQVERHPEHMAEDMRAMGEKMQKEMRKKR